MYDLIETEQHIDETLGLLSEIWRRNPDMTLCELITSCFPRGTDLYYQHDPDLINAMLEKYM